ncbi:PGF-pre-PGF domain-containing protein [Halobellus sp. GM3]|uniref:PGF-pre-PGF domain-containing protein n=1 Tax=Halobellus sp. GM3 TaxID=3458410 RepID=UPI00403DDDE5
MREEDPIPGRTTLLAAVVAVVVVLSVAVGPAAAAELRIDEVDLPSSVTQGDEFDIQVSVEGEAVEDVGVTLSLPDGLSCSPGGTQDVSLSDGEGTATFSCTAGAPGEYDGDIGVTLTGDRTDDGTTISDGTQTGISVLSPASLTLSTSVDDASIDEGGSTGLTVVVHNTGDQSTSYTASVSPDTGLSVDDADASGSVDGGGIDTVEFSLTGDAGGDRTVDITVNGDNDQTLTGSETVEVTVPSGGGGGDGGSTGPAAPSTADPGDLVLPSDAVQRQASRDLADVDPDRAGVQVRFEESETETMREISFASEDVAGTGAIEVRESDAVSPDVSPPTGGVRSAVEITVPESARNSPATLRVSLSADRIETSPERVVIQRYDAETDTWAELETSVVSESGEVVEFEAETPGFSLFAVTESNAATATTVTTETRTATDAPGTTEARTSSTTTATGTPGFGAAVTVAAVLGAALVAARRRRH